MDAPAALVAKSNSLPELRPSFGRSQLQHVPLGTPQSWAKSRFSAVELPHETSALVEPDEKYEHTVVLIDALSEALTQNNNSAWARVLDLLMEFDVRNGCSARLEHYLSRSVSLLSLLSMTVISVHFPSSISYIFFELKTF